MTRRRVILSLAPLALLPLAGSLQGCASNQAADTRDKAPPPAPGAQPVQPNRSKKLPGNARL